MRDWFNRLFRKRSRPSPLPSPAIRAIAEPLEARRFLSARAVLEPYLADLHAESISLRSSVVAAPKNRRTPSSSSTANATGQLSGQSVAAASSYDLSALGTDDWVHFGRDGTFGKLDRDADGDSQISNVTVMGSGAESSGGRDPSRSVKWTNPDGVSHSDQTGYIRGYGAPGSGFRFTVPAGSAARTLFVYAGGEDAQITLTGRLSDGSAADYVSSEAGSGLFANLFTITFQAASQNQKLIITVLKTGSVTGADGSVDLIAAALGGAPITTLASFLPAPSDTDGDSPAGGLAVDAAGNLYGTTELGNVFRLSAGGGPLTTFAATTSNVFGSLGNAAVDNAGNIYGTASYNASGQNTIFEVAAGRQTATTVYTFENGDGSGGLISDAEGNLYGITYNEESENDGTVFELTANTHVFTTLATFNAHTGSDPAGLTIDATGNLYGTTDAGGAFHQGTVFTLRTGSHHLIRLASFSNADGDFAPDGNIIVDAQGDVYGTTADENDDGGSVFEIPAGSDEIMLRAQFGGGFAGAPGSGLVVDADGDLFGTFITDFDSLDGTQGVYEWSATTHELTDVATVSGGVGEFGGGDIQLGLIADAAGNLYGTTSAYPGGAGTIFEISGSGFVPFSPGTINTEPVAQTRFPNQTATFTAAAGNLAPAVQWQVSTDGGVTFSNIVGNSSAARTTLVLPSVNSAENGNEYRAVFTGAAGAIITSNAATLTVNASNGSLSGQQAAAAPDYNLTSLASDDWAHWGRDGAFGNFDDSDSSDPQISNITIVGNGSDSAGGEDPSRATSWTNGASTPMDFNDPGFIESGGALGTGFSFTVPADDVMQTLNVYTGGNGARYTLRAHLSDGSAPDYVATASGAGLYTNFFTIKFEAGSPHQTLTVTLLKTANVTRSNGSVDLIAALLGGPNQLNTLASFDGPNGDFANSLIADAAGNLYGTTGGGGTDGEGTVFEIASGTGTITTLENFDGGNDTYPDSLLLDPAGDLFGTSGGGGEDGDGTIFEIAAQTHKFTTLAQFNGTDGNAPNSLIRDATGNLYGTTGTGGTGYDPKNKDNGDGTVFEIAADTNTIESLASFDGADGGTPNTLAVAGSGTLYGTTDPESVFGNNSADSNVRYGTVFQLAAGTHALSTLATFDGTNGAFPVSLNIDPTGDLYGTTFEGGPDADLSSQYPGGNGTVFQVSVGTGALTTRAAFAGVTSWPTPVIMDEAGNLFGVGSFNGLVFEIPSGRSTIETLGESFAAATEGNGGVLVADAAGNLFGTSYVPDSGSSGQIFELTDGGFVPADASPIVSNQPRNQSALANGSATFAAAATGFPTPAVQWQVSTDSGRTFTDVIGIPSATRPALTLTDLTTSQSGDRYRAVFTNALGTATTAAATLALAPLLVVSPAQATPSMATGTFTLLKALRGASSGQSNLIYRWSAISIPKGAALPTISAYESNAPQYAVATFHKAGRYRFRCTISDRLGHTVATDVSVDVAQMATSVRLKPHDKTIQTGKSLRFQAAVFDQFGHPLQLQPTFSYSVDSGSGNIGSSSGIFDALAPGPVTIEADTYAAPSYISSTVGLQVIP